MKATSVMKVDLSSVFPFNSEIRFIEIEKSVELLFVLVVLTATVGFVSLNTTSMG